MSVHHAGRRARSYFSQACWKGAQHPQSGTGRTPRHYAGLVPDLLIHFPPRATGRVNPRGGEDPSSVLAEQHYLPVETERFGIASERKRDRTTAWCHRFFFVRSRALNAHAISDVNFSGPTETAESAFVRQDRWASAGRDRISVSLSLSLSFSLFLRRGEKTFAIVARYHGLATIQIPDAPSTFHDADYPAKFIILSSLSLSSSSKRDFYAHTRVSCRPNITDCHRMTSSRQNWISTRANWGSA